MRRSRRVLVAASALLLATVSFAVYARVGVDYDALVLSRRARVLARASPATEVERAELAARAKAMARFHRGPPPCLAYAAPSDPSPEELAQIERDLRGARLLSRLRELFSLFFVWADEDETRRHGEVSDEELLTGFDDGATLRERLIALFAGAQIANAERAAVARDRASLASRAESEKKSLTEHEEEALYGLWLRHPRALSFPDFVRTSRTLPKE